MAPSQRSPICIQRRTISLHSGSIASNGFDIIDGAVKLSGSNADWNGGVRSKTLAFGRTGNAHNWQMRSQRRSLQAYTARRPRSSGEGHRKRLAGRSSPEINGIDLAAYIEISYWLIVNRGCAPIAKAGLQ